MRHVIAECEQEMVASIMARAEDRVLLCHQMRGNGASSPASFPAPPRYRPRRPVHAAARSSASSQHVENKRRQSTANRPAFPTSPTQIPPRLRVCGRRVPRRWRTSTLWARRPMAKIALSTPCRPWDRAAPDSNSNPATAPRPSRRRKNRLNSAATKNPATRRPHRRLAALSDGTRTCPRRRAAIRGSPRPHSSSGRSSH